MKKIYSTLAMFILTSTIISAQQASEGRIKYKKVEQPALLITYNYPQTVVENALRAKMTDLRLKSSNNKDFITYNNSVIKTISSSPLDYSFKLEGATEKTTIYMLMEGNNTLNGDPEKLAKNGKDFLESLAPNIAQSNTIVQIKQHEDDLVTEEQKLKKLQDDYAVLDKKMKANLDEQSKQTQLITSKKNVLEALKKK